MSDQVERNRELFDRFPELGEQWWCDTCDELTLDEPCQVCGGVTRRIKVVPASTSDKYREALDALVVDGQRLIGGRIDYSPGDPLDTFIASLNRARSTLASTPGTTDK